MRLLYFAILGFKVRECIRCLICVFAQEDTCCVDLGAQAPDRREQIADQKRVARSKVLKEVFPRSA